MVKHYIIYETKNLKNGKIYIGMHETYNLEDGYLGSGHNIKRAIRYYGKEFFERKILFTFNNREDMIVKEIELVNKDFIKRKDTYNIMIGGKGGFISANQQLKRAKAASKAFSNKLKTDKDFAIKFSKSCSNTMTNLHKAGKIKIPNWSGKTHSEETKEQMRKSQSGKQSGSKNSQFGKFWITNGKENKKVSTEIEIPKGWKKGRKLNAVVV